MCILITGGGCEEPIDGVRSICNFSTGKTASFLADWFASRGSEVIELRAEHAARPTANLYVKRFRRFDDLAALLQRELETQDIDLVIHAAAVSDYRPHLVEVNGIPYAAESVPKIESGAEVVIRLKGNPKLIDNLREWSRNPDCRIVGFKLTNSADIPARQKAAAEILYRSKVDLIVGNDRTEISETQHITRCYRLNTRNEPECVFQGQTQNDLAEFLFETFADATDCGKPAYGRKSDKLPAAFLRKDEHDIDN